MKTTGKIVGDVTFTAKGQAILSLAVDNQHAALEAFDDLKDKPLDIEVKRHREKRTLDQNAYFHVLVNAIARKVRASDEDVKYNLVTKYGVLATDADGNKVAIKLPASADPKELGIAYAVCYKTVSENGILCKCYKVYGQTRYYNTAEMNALIDGAIFDAKELGIQTDTPDEIALMKAQWNDEKRKGKNDT